MIDTLYAVIFGLQPRQIKDYCLGACGKGIIAVIDDPDLGPLQTCREANCPYLDTQMDGPIGEVDGSEIVLRKLIGGLTNDD